MSNIICFTYSRYVVLTQKTLNWYGECDSEVEPSLGSVQIDHILDITPLKRGPNEFIFKVQVDRWTRRGQPLEEARKIVFTSKSVSEGEEWLAYLEYMKTKFTYDNFVNKYCTVKFPLSNEAAVMAEN